MSYDKNKQIRYVERAASLLSSRCLDKALSLLAEYSQQEGWLDLNTEAKKIQENYQLLLQYAKGGGNDPTRSEQLDNLYIQAWELQQQIEHVNTKSDPALSDSLTSQMMENFRSGNPTSEERDRQLGELFGRIKTCYPLSRELRNELHELLLDEQLPIYERATLLSALLLNLLKYYDADMLEKVYTYTLDDQPSQIRVQALITLVLCAKRHQKRIECDCRARELYKLLNETNGELITAIQASLFGCKAAKDSPLKLFSLVKLELAKVKANAPLDDRALKDFFEIMKDGVDHEFLLFKRQIRKKSFFAVPENEHHWLMPFSLEQPMVKRMAETYTNGELFMRIMECSLSQCNSSKYAQIIDIAKSIPEVIEQMNKSPEFSLQLDEVAKPNSMTIQRNYLHELYRYAFLSKGEVPELIECFKDDDLSECSCLHDCLDDANNLEPLCRHLYASRLFGDAARCLRRYTRKHVTQELLEMQIQAAEESGEKAILTESILRYFSLYSHSEKLYASLANSYTNPVQAESTLHEAMKLYPESDTLTFQMAKCLKEQQRYEEAMSMLQRISPQSELTKQSDFYAEQADILLLMHQAEKAEQMVNKGLKAEECGRKIKILSVFTALLTIDALEAAGRFANLCLTLDGTFTLPDDYFAAIVKQEEKMHYLGSNDSQLTLVYDLGIKILIALKDEENSINLPF